MGDAILGAVVEVTLSKVISVATEQLNLAVGFKQELKKFRVVLNMVRGVLQDAEQKKVMGHCDLKPWLEELRSIADEAEDVMDEIAYENLRCRVAAQTDQNQMWRRKVGYLFTLSYPLIFRRKMAKGIKHLNSELAQLNDWATGLGLQYRLSVNIPEQREPQQTDSSLGDPSQVIGREGDAQKIVQLLIDSGHDDQPLRVLSIVGLAGLGKTTLAKLVCNDKLVQRHFFKIMWVCVSGHFYMKSILGEMLESLTKRKSVTNQDAMVKKLKEKLAGKNYLLVLDDVWNEDRQKWEELKSLLLGISKKVGSGVLVTTRNHNVASMMGSLLEIEQLNVVHCWSIIRQKAFGSSAVPSKLGHIGREIAKKCNGVPLVASVVGGTLCNNRNRNEWLSVKEKIGAWGSLEVDNYNAILRVSQLSFDRLPTPALKQCFAFCSIFPKNFVMEKEILIQLWMAAGFLQGLDSSIEMEDIGDQYFNYLLSCSFFQDVERDSCGNIITCKMHDLMHDLAKSVSKSETLILENGGANNFSNNIRHLNLIYGEGMATTDVRDAIQKLRTLFSNVGVFGNILVNSRGLLQAPSFYGAERLPQASSFFGADIDDMIVNLKRLRVLSFHGANNIDRLPALLGKLKHLKYLDVSGTTIKELPKFITKLYQLQTFRFMDCVCIERPLEGIENLVNLRYIYFNNKEHMPAGIGSLTCLRTLLLFVVGQKKRRGIEELGCLSKLRGRLKICNLEKVGNKAEAMRAKLFEKTAIHQLALDFEQEDVDEAERGKHDEDVLEGLKPHSNLKKLTVSGYYGENSPSWMSKGNGSLGESAYLKNLFSLNFISCYRLKSLPRICGLPSLQILELRHCPKLSGVGDNNSRLFHSLCLQELTLYDCPDLISMPLDGLPSLQKIYIYSCGQLKSIGETLSASTCLKDLTIEYCPDLTYVPSLHGLSSLQSLRIACCGGLTSLPIGLSSCTALEELTIEHCHDLISIPEDLRSIPEEGLCCLARLKVVSITYISEELQEFPDVLLQPSLEELTLIGWKKLKLLPHQIQHLTALMTLWIQEFHELEVLPDWLGNLSSLQSLRILFCKSLMHLPSKEAMQCLSKLDSLEISGCLELQLKCDRRSGSEWDKISHIPTIIIGWEWIQDRGASGERWSTTSHYDDDEIQIAITPASASANYDAEEGQIAIASTSTAANNDDNDESQLST